MVGSQPLPPPHASWRSLRSLPTVGPPLPGFLFGFQSRWPFLQLNSELVGLVEGRTLALPGELFAGGGQVGEGLQVIGASASGHLDAHILTCRPLSGQLALPAASMLGQAAEVSDITQAP